MALSLHRSWASRQSSPNRNEVSIGGCVTTQNGRRACPGTPCFRSLLALAAYQDAGIVQQVQANCSPTSFSPRCSLGKPSQKPCNGGDRSRLGPGGGLPRVHTALDPMKEIPPSAVQGHCLLEDPVKSSQMRLAARSESSHHKRRLVSNIDRMRPIKRPSGTTAHPRKTKLYRGDVRRSQVLGIPRLSIASERLEVAFQTTFSSVSLCFPEQPEVRGAMQLSHLPAVMRGS